MQSSAQWALRLLSQPSTQARRYPVNPVQSIRYFSSWYSLLSTPSKDPEKLEASRKYQREYQLRRRREDEAYRDLRTAAHKKYIQKRCTDPAEVHALRRQDHIYKTQRYASDKEYRERIGFLSWVTQRYKGIREGLIWKTHVPVLYKEKVEHSCIDCGYSRRGGLKFWWRQISDPSLYKCHSCYSSPEVSKAMPVGWEYKTFNRRKASTPSQSEVGAASSPPSNEIESDTQEEGQYTKDGKKW